MRKGFIMLLAFTIILSFTATGVFAQSSKQVGEGCNDIQEYVVDPKKMEVKNDYANGSQEITIKDPEEFVEAMGFEKPSQDAVPEAVVITP